MRRLSPFSVVFVCPFGEIRSTSSDVDYPRESHTWARFGLYFAAFHSLPSTQLEVSRPPYIQLVWGECWKLPQRNVGQSPSRNRMWCSLALKYDRLLPGWAGTRKVKKLKLIWVLLKQETVSGSGISWTICKSAPLSRQISTPVPHHSVFHRPDSPPASQPTASKHWRTS